VDKHALLASIQHQITLLARAIQQPDSSAIAPGDLVQIAPDADPLFSRYFLHVASVNAQRARGPLLTTHREQWLNLPVDNCARIGCQLWAPERAFHADPIRSPEQRQANSDAYEAKYAAIARTRAATIANKRALAAAREAVRNTG